MTETKPTDLSRWNRAERRKFRAQTKLTIPGRNLPFIKRQHGTISKYNSLREQELSQEKKPNE